MWQICSGLMIFFLFFFQLLFAEGGEKGKKLNKIHNTASYTHFTINNISSWFYADGDSDQDPSGNSGLIYPKDSKMACVFETGFVWGGIIDGYTEPDSIRVGGSTYRSSLKQGRIKKDGSAMDPGDPRTRIYRVRPNYKTADLSDEMNLSGLSYENVLAQYELDWLQWPAEWGAPFEDINSNGVYEPEIDIPGVTGAHQTLWFVANDLDVEQSRYMYGSDPLGLEMQATIWGYNFDGPLGNTVFRKYTLLNKGQYSIKKMHLSLWSDVDLGNASDDQIGYDQNLELAFTYNGYNSDFIYSNTPPAVGFTQLIGPNNQEDEKLDVTVFAPGFKNHPTMNDPDQGTYDGTIQMFNYLLGYTGYGIPWTVPTDTGWAVTKFPLTGPPSEFININGLRIVPGDRRMQICSGPITLEPGDTQSVTYAQIVTGVTENETNFQAAYKLKDYTRFIRKIYSAKINWIGESANIIPKSLSKENKIFLYWGDDSEKNNYLETTDFSGYKFQGYNIYQLPYSDSKIEEGIRIATFDKNDGVREIFSGNQVLLTGTDSGIKREFILERDIIKDEPLYNYNRYYYAVTAYFYFDNPELYDLQVFETDPRIIEAIPGKSDEGIELNNQPDDLISVSHSGNSNTELIVKVINPEELQTKNYKVKIEEEGWRLFDVDSNSYINNDIINYRQASTDDYNSFYKNGLEITVEGSTDTPSGIYKVEKWMNHNPTIVDFHYYGKKETTTKYILGQGTQDPDVLDDNYKFVFNGLQTKKNDTLFVVDESTGSFATIIGAKYYSLSEHPLNPDPGSDEPFKIRIPFEVWNLSNNQKINILFYDYQQLEADYFYSFNPYRSDCFILNAPYQETAIDTSSNIMSLCTWAISIRELAWEWQYENTLLDGGVTLIFNNRLIPGEDEFSFSTQGPTYSIEKAKEDADQINVFPNPLYGYNTNDLSSADRFMTFTHLPNRAEIIIFNLAGQYVTKLNKNDDQDFMVWDLTNDNKILVGSGIYIVRVHLPDLGKTKILKAAIIQAYY